MSYMDEFCLWLTLLLELCGGGLPYDGPHGSQTPQESLQEPALCSPAVPYSAGLPLLVVGWGGGGRLWLCWRIARGGGVIRLLCKTQLVKVMVQLEHTEKHRMQNKFSYCKQITF